MSHILPLLNTTNRFPSPTTSKRKCLPYVQKAAPTCTLSLTSVSVSIHSSSDSLNFVPFPTAPASIPFPSGPTNTRIPTSPSPIKSPSNIPPRPRIRTHASPLRRKRSMIRLLQPLPVSSSEPAESEPELVSPTPRKRARKTNISRSSSSSSSPIPSNYHSLTISSLPQKRPRASKKVAADLRFVCTLYRSIAWMRVQRDLSDASRCTIKTMEAMDIDVAPPPISALDEQESLLASRLRSYLVFHEMNPDWLDVTPSPTVPFPSEAGMDMDDLLQDSGSVPPPWTHLPPPSRSPMLTADQVTALLFFRFRHRSKGKSRPEAATAGDRIALNPKRRSSPLASPEASLLPEEELIS